TTFEPGARDDFTHGLVLRPLFTAFRASKPAASITEGFDVFVQLVIAAITTAPFLSAKVLPLYSTLTPSSLATAGAATATPPDAFSAAARAPSFPPVAAPESFASSASTASRYIDLDLESGTRSCGRFGPARLGSTLLRSSSSVSVNSGSGVESVRKS